MCAKASFQNLESEALQRPSKFSPSVGWENVKMSSYGYLCLQELNCKKNKERKLYFKGYNSTTVPAGYKEVVDGQDLFVVCSLLNSQRSER